MFIKNIHCYSVKKEKVMQIKIFGIIVLLMLFGISISEARSVRVKSSVTKTGTYRLSHMRTSPNKTKIDNWSTKGNVNPYTSKQGSKKAY